MSRSSKTAFALTAVIAMLGVASYASSGSDAGGSQSVASCSAADGRVEWSVYTNEVHRFRIKYPCTFNEADAPDALVTNGAVVTFIPAYDPSINEAGDRTNLISLSVTIGVSVSTGTPEQESGSGALNDPSRTTRGRYPRFVRSYVSEGAAGNRYETWIFATTLAEKRYEIALFVHSANPGCYPVGTIAVFDSASIARLFETMASTFLLTVSGSPCWVE